MIRYAAAFVLALSSAVPALACFDRYNEDFGKHPADVHDGERKPVDFASHPFAAKLSDEVKARIRTSVASGPNFAGAYRLVHLRCGETCSKILVISIATGKIHLLQGRGAQFGEFRADSRFLVITNPELGTTEYYVFDGRRFQAAKPSYTPSIPES